MLIFTCLSIAIMALSPCVGVLVADWMRGSTDWD